MLPFRLVRLTGIAIGSLVAAALVMWLLSPIVGWIFGSLTGLVTLLLGGLIYADIRRRDRPPA
jgi:hypothetical protein